MKKLTAAMFAVVLAATANAAYVDWAITKQTAYQQDGTTYWGGNTYYLVNTSVAAWSSIYSDIKTGKVTASTISASAAFVDSAVGNSTAKSSGNVALRTSPDSSALSEGADAALAYVLFQKVDGKDWYFVSATATGTAYDPNGDIDTEGQSVTFVAADYANGSGWKAVSSVPEPTSGLLMLLGCAGLALRRKRA